MYNSNIFQSLLIFVRHTLIDVRVILLRRIYGMTIGKDTRISFKANLDKRYPKGVHLGDGTYMAFGATVLCHDMSRNIRKDVNVGKNCFIGARSMLMPGVTLGDSTIVAAGSIVTKSFDGHCIIAGNPAKVIREGVKTLKWGRITD